MIIFVIFARRTWRGRRWYFHARGMNNEIILASEGYMTRAAAEKTVQLIKREAAAAGVVIRDGEVR